VCGVFATDIGDQGCSVCNPISIQNRKQIANLKMPSSALERIVEKFMSYEANDEKETDFHYIHS
jgi:hypothetical protein